MPAGLFHICRGSLQVAEQKHTVREKLVPSFPGHLDQLKLIRDVWEQFPIKIRSLQKKKEKSTCWIRKYSRMFNVTYRLLFLSKDRRDLILC